MGKVLSLNEMCEERKILREKGLKLVFTNGCFDILHRGHVRMLQDARALGDALIVAVNSDSSVKAIKGPRRPVCNEEDRSEVIAALGCVDYVVIFQELKPQETLIALQPDVLVKGGDYTIDKIEGHKEVLAWGGTVKSLPFTENSSTTSTIERILELYSERGIN